MKTHTRFLRKVILFLLGVGVLAGFPVWAQSSHEFPPGIDWQQVETEHFRIVYDAAYQTIAEKVADMAEPIHKQVTEFLRSAPKAKTTVILTDHVDFVNGYASPLPRNRIVLFLREPGAGDSLFGLRSPDWLALVLTHEYTHIVQLDMVDGLSAVGRNIFGRIVIPNAGLDVWMIEGLAVYSETKFQNGRGHHPAYDMYMRADVLADCFKTLEQMAVMGQRAWPLGTVHYLYGYFFLQYLDDTYGEDKMVELSVYNSGRMLWQRNIFKTVYDGKTLAELWEKWRAAMQARYQQQIEQLSADPLTATTALTTSGYATNSPVYAPDGAYIYYSEIGAHDTPALIQYRVSDGAVTRLTESGFTGNFSVSPDGQTIYFGRIDAYKTYSAYSDLYALDVKSRNVRRLTRGQRVIDSAVSPDGKTLVFTATHAGSMMLWQMDLERGDLTALWQTDDHTQMFHPAFAPDGSRLALTVWVEGGFQDIYVMDRDGHNRYALTHDRATDSSPTWGPDGNEIFFASDRTGVSNIFVYDLADNALYQATNVLTGAFDPAIAPDGRRMAFELYSSNGMDIHLTDLNRETWRAAPFQPENLPELPAYQVAEVKKPLESRSYSAFSSILPTFWIPGWGEDEAGYQLGASTFGRDMLGRHEYELMALYGLESERVSLFGSYTNRQFFPDISLFGFDLARPFGDIFTNADGNDQTYWQREQAVGVNIGVPLYVSRNTTVTASVGYRYTRMEALNAVDGVTPPPDQGNLSGVSLSLGFQNLDSSIYAIAPESGVATSITYRRDDTELNSDFTLDTIVADTRAYLEIPKLRHHVLALRLAGGASSGDTLSQGIFRIGGFDVDSGLATLDQQRYFLRGYTDGQFSGNRFALGSVEYRLPLWYPQRGIGNGVVFLDSVVATAFYDVGYAWDGDLNADDLKHGVGGELRVNLSLLKGAIPLLTLRAGYARGLDDDDGKSQFIYGVNFDFWL